MTAPRIYRLTTPLGITIGYCDAYGHVLCCTCATDEVKDCGVSVVVKSGETCDECKKELKP